MITFEDIAKKFDDKPIASIEIAAKTFNQKSKYNRKEFILTLFYLERTNRYKENLGYRNESFRRYIDDMFKLSYNNFKKEQFAYITVPDATEHHGVGVIDKIRSECGSHKVVEVIQEIDDKKIIKPVEIDKVIKKHAKPKKVKPAKKTVQKAEQEKINTHPIDIPKEKERADRISRLLKTVKDQQETIMLQKMEIKRLETENMDLKQRMQSAFNFVNPKNTSAHEHRAHM